MYSKLWLDISRNFFSGNKISEHTLSNFREPGKLNSRLAAQDPMENSSRYFKSVLYTSCKNQPKIFFESYKKIENTSLGCPPEICVDKLKINIDYFFSVEEFLFLKNNLNFNKIHQVLEIGAGFGRTCHTLMSLNLGISKYIIVDLPEVLELSRIYLKRVLPHAFHLVEFIDCTSLRGGGGGD
jgi:putative sugar O-methyltransferase